MLFRNVETHYQKIDVVQCTTIGAYEGAKLIVTFCCQVCNYRNNIIIIVVFCTLFLLFLHFSRNCAVPD
jgi:succinate-acetate transporter protein